jgi:hypothetical protein
MRSRKKEPDLSSGDAVFALLLNKSAIGIYSSQEKAEAAWSAFQDQNPRAGPFDIKPFTLDGPAMIFAPY